MMLLNFKGKAYIVFITIFALLFCSIQSTNANMVSASSDRTSQTISPIIEPNIIENCELLGSWDENFGEATDVAIYGNYAYVATVDSAVVIMDISDKENIQFVSTFGLSCVKLDLEGNILCTVVPSSNGFTLFDISNPTSPLFLDSYNTGGYPYDVDITNDTAFIADGSGGLKIVNISNPTNVQPISSFSGSTLFLGVNVFDHYAYISAENEVIILDIEDLDTPEKVGNYTDSEWMSNFLDVYVDGVYMYAAAGWYNHVQIVNITDKSDPTFIKKTCAHGAPRDVEVVGDILYVSAFGAGLYAIDVSNVNSPVELDQISCVSGFQAFTIKGNSIFISDSISGLTIINITTPSSMNQLDNFGFGDRTYDVYLDGNILYMANFRDGLRVFDISNYSNPEEIIHMSSSTYDFVSVEKYGDVLYVCDVDYGIRLYNVSTPYSIIEIGSITSAPTPYKLTIYGDLLFVAAHYNGLRIYNISDLTSITNEGFFNDGGCTINVVAFNENYVYVAGGLDGLEVINVTDPTNPTLAGKYDTGELTNDVDFYDEYIILTQESNGFLVLEQIAIDDYANISTYYDSGSYTEAVIKGNYLYLADETDGLKVYNITDPLNINKLGQYDDNVGYGMAVDVDETGVAFLSDYSDGLEIIELDSDADGLNDYEETEIYGTNPQDSDTDNDGLLDGEEVNDYNTDPLDEDTDDDSLMDGDELDIGTDPLDEDSDDDGLSDGEEVFLGADGYITNPLDDDTDDDDYTDGEEYLAGTDPTDPEDYPGKSSTKVGSLFNSLATLSGAVFAAFIILATIRKRAHKN